MKIFRPPSSLYPTCASYRSYRSIRPSVYIIRLSFMFTFLSYLFVVSCLPHVSLPFPLPLRSYMSILPYPTQSDPILPYCIVSYGFLWVYPTYSNRFVYPNLIVYPICMLTSLSSLYLLPVYLSTCSQDNLFFMFADPVCLSFLPILYIYVMYPSVSHRSFLPILSSIFILSVLSFLPILSILFVLSRPSCVSCLRMLSAYPIISFLYIPVYLSNCLAAYHICQSIYLSI